MIYVDCSRDARKGLGLGFGSCDRGREMDIELEEGEACSYQNMDDYDANIDPDIALSYLDEKLHDVLGHFQKDFEGGVSAENLGPKFGGYGSFLPTYQRSPVWSHTPRSPNNVPLEGGRCYSAVSVTVPHSVGRGPASTSSSSLPDLKAALVNDSGKQEVSKLITRVGKMTSRVDSNTKKTSNISDQKILKVRIKMGSDNLSDKKKAAIYSGLGLDDSPSCSMDDSPSESEGRSHESPISILQTMTSFLVHGGKILSPLSDDLIHLVEEEKAKKGGRYMPLSRGGLESCGFLINDFDAVKNEGKVLGEKNSKSVDRNDHSAESKSGSNGNTQNGSRAASIKEKDTDALACEELVSKTLKLPILSNSYSSYGDLTKDREFNKGVLKNKVISDHLEEQPNESTYTEDDGWVEKHRIGLVGKGLEDSKVGCNNIPSNKEGLQKRQKAYDSVKADSHIKDKKALDAEVMDSSKSKGSGNSMSHEPENTRLARGHDHPLLGGKDKMKEHHSTLAVESTKEISMVGSSGSKIKKNTRMDNSASNSNAENFKSCKDLKKNGDSYKDFFGELDEEENQMYILEMPSNDKIKDHDGFSRSTYVINNARKDRQIAKKIDKPLASKACPTMALEVAPSSANGTISDATPASGDAVLIKENWVQCEKCQKWRVLPLGKNPDDLPEKWLCRMLTWLPGMNRCNISEEETTKAVAALNQPPAPGSQNNLHRDPRGFSTAATLANFRHPDQNLSSLCSHDVADSGKKKHGIKVTRVTGKGSPSHLSNSMKKSTQASVKSRSSNDVNHSPLVNESDQQVSKSNMASEKQKHKYKDKNRVTKSHINGGDTKHLDIRRKRDADQDSFSASKKIKSEGLNIIDEDWASDHSWAAGRIYPSSSSGAHTSSAGKGRSKYSNSSSKNPKTDASDRLQVPLAKSKVKAEVLRDDGYFNIEDAEIRGDAKKRKIREFQNGSLPITRFQDGMASIKEFSENDYKKEKKMRICSSDGKESSTRKGCGKASRHGKNQQHGQDLTSNLSQRSLDGMDSLKRDSQPMQTSLAATSSSSKVSGSHKTKSSFQEVKGSPVESVSSSPMRIPNPEQLTPLGGGFKAKGGPRDVGYYAMCSTRKSFNAEDFEGKDQAQAGRKGEMSTLSRKQVSSDNHHCVNGIVDSSGQDTEHPVKTLASDKFCDEERKNEGHYQVTNGPHPRKSGKGSSQSKDKNWNLKSDIDMRKIKISGDLKDLYEHTSSFDVKPEDSKNKFHEKFASKLDETDDRFVGKKDFTGELSSESSKRESYLNLRWCDAQNLKANSSCKNGVIFTPNPDLFQDCNDDKSSKRLLSEQTGQVEIGSGGGRPLPLPPKRGAQNETYYNQSVTVSRKENGAGSLQVDATERDALEVHKHMKTADNQNGSQHTSSRHPTKSGHKTRDLDAPSPLKRDSSSQAATNALKEAKDLKHLADRLKKAGSTESTTFYFQAALKFLHGASLLETSGSESAKHNDMLLSMQIYSSSAKLCEFCAHEYEKRKDMATAALAYKCMEVAYMRVVYSSHVSANRDRNELQSSLQVVPPGESPSSSASDVDNLNNLNTVDMVTLPKGVSSPQVAPNHVIAARSQPSFVRLLNFAQDVNFAMEASRKSRIAFSSAHLSMPEAKHEKGITSIKRALDYNFQDIDGFVHMVRIAMDIISS